MDDEEDEDEKAKRTRIPDRQRCKPAAAFLQDGRHALWCSLLSWDSTMLGSRSPSLGGHVKAKLLSYRSHPKSCT